MGELRLSHPAYGIAGKSRLTPADIDILREHVFSQGITSSQEAVTLFAINTACAEKCPEWHHYFLDSISGFVLHHCEPHGSLDERNADWLIGMISTGGTVNSPIELELLFHVIDVSPFVPDSLTFFALQQLRTGIRDGVGAWGTMRHSRRPILDPDDVHMACRVMSAIARSRGGKPTPRENEILVSIGVLPGAAAA
ncbi:hypothetical protein [Pararhizobium antarcticum]|nr:hypothetical protein [Pararhizobium antarcticum]